MKHKILTTIFAILLLVGFVTAAGTIMNISESLEITPSTFIAGSTTIAEFSFDYPNLPENYNNAPLVARVNITSLNSEYPVWKGDFELQMIAEQYWLFDLIHINTIPMTCEENAPIKFKAKDKSEIQYTINDLPNGTFYCYNPNYYMMQLDSHDELTLSISSDPALYPGEYEIEVELMEMEPDDSPPEIELILNNFIFNENQTIPIKLNVTDLYEIRIVEYKITNPDLSSYYNSGWIEVQLNESSGFYEDEFYYSDYNLTEDGTYWIFARACDVLGNCREM